MMKRVVYLLILCLCLAQIVLGENPAMLKSRENEEKELIALEQRRSQAIARHDMKFLEEIYADDFRGVTAIGYEVDKAKLMQVFKLDDPRTKFSTDDLSARVFGKAAIVTGRLTGRTPAGEITSQSRYMHVYVKRGNRWQIVAGQGTPLRTLESQK